MNLDDLQKKLLAAARSHPPADAVPYAFEKRIMARLGAARNVADGWTFWGRALWRAAVPCVAMTLLLAVWTSVVPVTNHDADLDLESAIFGVDDQPDNPL